MIDKQRLAKYLKELQVIQRSTGHDRFIQQLEARMFELLLRKKLSVDELPLITEQLDRLFSMQYAAWERNVLDSYNDVSDLVNQEYDDIGPQLVRQARQLKAVEQANRLQLDNYQESTRDAIRRVVEEGVKDSKSYNEITRDLKDLGGTAEFYAETLAGTHLKRYARNMKYQKSLISGTDIFLYAGVLRDTTRAFCRACLNRHFHIDDILVMRNGNLEPVIENCGGWNCIHEWEPDPTASEADTVKGKVISLRRSGVTLIDNEVIKKTFKFSFGLERLGNRKNIQKYIDKSRNFEMSPVNIQHGRDHYPGISDLGLKRKVSQIKNNPDKIYYQYNNGPRIVFEKDGEFLFTSAGRFRSVFRPEPYDKYEKNLLIYLVELKGYK